MAAFDVRLRQRSQAAARARGAATTELWRACQAAAQPSRGERAAMLAVAGIAAAALAYGALRTLGLVVDWEAFSATIRALLG